MRAHVSKCKQENNQFEIVYGFISSNTTFNKATLDKTSQQCPQEANIQVPMPIEYTSYSNYLTFDFLLIFLGKLTRVFIVFCDM